MPISAALLLAFQVAAAPAPSSEPLRTIVTVETSPVCTALHEVVAPVVRDVLDNDGELERSVPLLDAAGSNDVMAPKVGMAMMRLETPETVIARQIIDAEKRLGDARLTQAKSSQIDAIRLQLEAVLDRQKAALNVISGVAETGSFDVMMHTQGADVMTNANAPVAGPASVKAMGGAVGQVLSLAPDAPVNVDASGRVAYEALAEQPAERAAAALIMTLAPGCR